MDEMQDARGEAQPTPSGSEQARGGSAHSLHRALHFPEITGMF